MSLVSSILSVGAGQLGVPGMTGQFAKGFDLSTETILVGLQFVIFGIGAWYFRQAATSLPALLESCKSSTNINLTQG
jgi:hypothetical protein